MADVARSARGGRIAFRTAGHDKETSAGWPLQQEDPWSAHGGCHQLSVNGKQSKITDDDLLMVADRFAIGTAPRVLREVKSALQDAPLPGF